MTMLPMKKTCPFCGKEYSFNPDVGMMFCPRKSCREKLGKSPEIPLPVPGFHIPKMKEEK